MMSIHPYSHLIIPEDLHEGSPIELDNFLSQGRVQCVAGHNLKMCTGGCDAQPVVHA